MGLAVVTVASGGLPVVDVTPIASMTPRKYGTPVTEAANGRGIRVTKVPGKPGIPVIYVVPPLLRGGVDEQAGRGRAGPVAHSQAVDRTRTKRPS
jgi:hypothetical protein